MKKYCINMLPVLILVLGLFMILGIKGNRSITTMTEHLPIKERKTVIIDPGHGGEDGGASTSAGVLESQINLEISLRLRDMLNLLGIKTVMIRTEDISIYTSGNTLSQKKISDLKQRVAIANREDDSIYISIHQNHFSNERYCGAQVFYGKNPRSKELAQKIQTAYQTSLGCGRYIKKGNGIYILENIKNPCVLLECGFLSNPQEAYRLQDPQYQKILALITACECSIFLSEE